MAMDGIKNNLVAARTLLNTSLDRSRALSMELDKTGTRLEQIKHRLPSLVVPMQKCSFSAVRDQIDGVIGSASALLKVFDAVAELQKSLLSSEAFSDLFNYLSVMKQLEEAMKFLADNCRLAIQWLEGIVEALEETDRYISKPLIILHQLQDTDACARSKGGILFEALEKLQTEFKYLVTENTIPFDLLDSSSPPSSSPVLMPVEVIQKLQAILHRLTANSRLENCISIYVEVRSSNIRTSLGVLYLEYLEISISEFDHVQDIEGSLDNWCKHFELVVKNLLEPEHKLCSDVFDDKIGSEVFAKMAVQSGILSFLQFGKKVTESKKDPIKLLKLLDIFAVLDNLRVDFNCLFGGEACGEIQTLTREVIKRVVNGACEIFWELPHQVKLQRKTCPPSNGSVPRLVSFVTEYCNQLLGDRYRPTLTQVLVIHQSWKQEKYEEGDFARHVYKIIEEIAVNLDEWSSALHVHDVTLSYLFMMNNHSHFCNLKGTELGEMMGSCWLRGHEQYQEYYAGLYMRESWGKLLLLLMNQDDGHAQKSNKRLKAFNEAFDCIYKKQANWVVTDESLKEKICKLLVQAFVPAYRNYLTEEDDVSASSSKHVKYSVQSLENMLSSLFQPKLTKQLHFIGKIKHAVANQFHFMLTAT